MFIIEPIRKFFIGGYSRCERPRKLRRYNKAWRSKSRIWQDRHKLASPEDGFVRMKYCEELLSCVQRDLRVDELRFVCDFSNLRHLGNCMSRSCRERTPGDNEAFEMNSSSI
ncbi:hypothetical protein KPH14_011936 [Odynerus spinipes]|uniref:Uncharacterized protein n=1 Tax=Odynerus spinipes TaxID=1348599 RepID=A0AAD9RC25_9HYME|nr:hypothetical protein KPH14_011936 [Odynerus spinipes]